MFSVFPSTLWRLREYILCLIIITKFEVWTITHCLGLGHETMVCAVCLSIFLRICDVAGLLRGTFVSWWYLPRIRPSVTDMQHYYHARDPIDGWDIAYIFSLVCFFRRSVPGRHVSPLRQHMVRSLRQGVCTPHADSPLTRKQNRRGDPAFHLSQAKGLLN